MLTENKIMCHHYSVRGEWFGYAVAFNYSNILNMIKDSQTVS